MEARIQRRIGLCDPGMSVIDTMSLAPLLDLDFTQGRHYAHRSVVASALTSTRASSALDYSVQPAVLRATNIPRYMQNSAIAGLNGILIEGADTNLCIRNEYSSFALVNWVTIAATITASTDVNLYNGGAIKCVIGAGDYAAQIVVTLAVKYVISTLLYTDGTAPTANQFSLTADLINPLTTTLEHLGNGVYLAWAVFTGFGPAGYPGVISANGVTCYISCLTCHIAAPANEGGDFPRSPIPNTTGASITRAADVLTIPGTGNIGTTEGTIDVEYIIAGTTSTLASFNIYKDANNTIQSQMMPTGNLFFTIRMGGVGTATANAALGAVHNNVLKFRLIYRQPTTLDGTNYAILYRSLNGGAWGQLCASIVQPTGVFDSSGTIYIGMSHDPAYRCASVIRRLRIKGVAELNPSW